MNHIGLFEGIGGFSLAAKWMDWKTIAWCEINPFGQQVLKHYYPEATGHGDIKTTDFSIYRGKCDILTGGFPCQPYSTAGKRKGTEDDRHLWPEMLRAIREIQPQWVVGENVGGIVSWSDGLVFEQVQIDLEAEGYEIQPFILPAAGVNAPHKRDRVWFIANNANARVESLRQGRQNKVYEPMYASNSNNSGIASSKCFNNSKSKKGVCQRNDAQFKSSGFSQYETSPNTTGIRERSGACEQREDATSREQLEGSKQGCNCNNYGTCGNATNSNGIRLRGQSNGAGNSGFVGENSKRNDWQNFPTQSPVCSRDDGIPSGLSGITISKHRNESLKAYGNAIVPQIAFEIFKAIQSYQEL